MGQRAFSWQRRLSPQQFALLGLEQLGGGGFGGAFFVTFSAWLGKFLGGLGEAFFVISGALVFLSEFLGFSLALFVVSGAWLSELLGGGGLGEAFFVISGALVFLSEFLGFSLALF